MLVLSSVSASTQESDRYCTDKSKQMILVTYTDESMMDARTEHVEVVQDADAYRKFVVMCGSGWPPYKNARQLSTVRVENRDLFLPYESMIKDQFAEKIIGSNLQNETFLMRKFNFFNRTYRIVKSPELAQKNIERNKRRIDRR